MNNIKTFVFWILSTVIINIIGFFLVRINNDGFMLYILQGVINGVSIFISSSIALSVTDNSNLTRIFLNIFNFTASGMWLILCILQIIAITYLIIEDTMFIDNLKNNSDALTEISAGISTTYASFKIYKKEEYNFQ